MTRMLGCHEGNLRRRGLNVFAAGSSKIGDVMKMLNLKDEDVRVGIKTGGQTVDWFYNFHFAVDYYAETEAN